MRLTTITTSTQDTSGNDRKGLIVSLADAVREAALQQAEVTAAERALPAFAKQIDAWRDNPVDLIGDAIGQARGARQVSGVRREPTPRAPLRSSPRPSPATWPRCSAAASGLSRR